MLKTRTFDPTVPLIFFALGVAFAWLFAGGCSRTAVHAPAPEVGSWLETPDGGRALDLDALFEAIAFVESSGYPGAFNAEEDAAGLLQIRPIMVRDVNRIVGYDRWSLDDRWSAASSREMLATYLGHYGAASYEQAARRWNGGPDGDLEWQTERYWDRVRQRLVL